MERKKFMDIKTIGADFTVCKLENLSAVDFSSEFCFIGKTDEELSFVCPTENMPDGATEREDGWKAFRLQGILDFSLIGILSKVAGLLADNGISIFAVSTFNTDYILVKAEHYGKALELLANAGNRII